jgi:SHS2 domain-containing protein
VAGSYRIIEHPSDIGVEASAESMEEAFALAAEGMMSVIADPGTVAPVESRAIVLPPMDEERLLVRWLGEVLFLYDGTGFLASRFTVGRATAQGLAAEARGEPVDPGRHALRLDVKAVTYHGVSVERNPGHCQVRVFLDI